MGNSIFLVLSFGCFSLAMVSGFGLVRDFIKTAKERHGTLRANDNKTALYPAQDPGEDPAENHAEDPAQDPGEDPAQDPGEDPAENAKINEK